MDLKRDNHRLFLQIYLHDLATEHGFSHELADDITNAGPYAVLPFMRPAQSLFVRQVLLKCTDLPAVLPTAGRPSR